METRLCAEGTMTTLHDFARGTDGQYPQSELTLGNDGNFYGTTPSGGVDDHGTAFKMTPAGEVTTLHNFAMDVDGYAPNRLVLGQDGNFYGTCFGGGGDENNIGSYGTIFKMTPEGTVTVLHQFLAYNADGLAPTAGLLQASDGNFYGVTEAGGDWGDGTIFKMDPDGGFTTLHSFLFYRDGRGLRSELIQGQDGDLYGTAFQGGEFDQGTVFKMTTTGEFTVLYSFSFADNAGTQPAAALVQATDGNFYGTTFSSQNGNGTVFKMTPGGVVSLLHALDEDDGHLCVAPLVQGPDGALFGTTSTTGAYPGGTLFKVTTSGIFTVLHAFVYGSLDGSQPEAGMALNLQGDLFGTTRFGGENQLGTIFRLTSQGVYTSIYSFSSDSDGYSPMAPLAEGSDGAFYGTNTFGGGSEFGAIFKVTSSGEFERIHSFTGDLGDGFYPITGLIEGGDGAFYGSNSSGALRGTIFQVTPEGNLTTLQNLAGIETGSHSSGLIEGYGGQLYGTTPDFDTYGSIFKLSLDGVMTTLHAFRGGGEQNPNGKLFLASDGKFYGTTYTGGVAGKGSIYALSPKGVFTTLFSFTGSENGEYPTGGLVEGADGSIYGTTISSFVPGTVFKITKTGVFTKVHSFAGSEWPNGDLIRASDGNIYGTTMNGGTVGGGTIFQIAAADAYGTAYSFGSFLGEGFGPRAGIIQGTNGKLYGTTTAGGLNDLGTVFQFSLPAFQTRVLLLQGNLAFGNVGVGTSKTASFRIKNTGTSPLHITGVSYPNGYSGSFAGTIPAGGFQNVAVTFAPTDVKPYNGTLLVSSDATSGANSLPISGRGVSRIVSLSGNMAFGNVPVNGTKTSQLTIKNTGNAPLNVTNISYPAGYSGNFAGTIAAGASQNVTVTFKPTAIQAYNGNITVNSNKTSGTNTLAVSGAGIAATRIIGLSGNLAFGSVKVAASKASTLTIKNTGNSPLSVTSITYPFPAYTGIFAGTIPPGGQQNVTFTFKPTTSTTYNGTVRVNGNQTSGANTIAISGTGTP